ncbi:DUF6525 family protein [Roseococcus sp.]|uniref:DUF6525 family protein n=1 Tax=Roseococcus sp. TaxID=2109646 RepID=UPI003BAD5DD1
MAALPPGDNDVTERPRIWRRFGGDDWAAFDALPPAVRQRLHEHAYDAWTVNALFLWKLFRRQTASSARGETRLLNHLKACEKLELEAFAQAYCRQCGGTLPHVAARASTLRYDSRPRR